MGWFWGNNNRDDPTKQLDPSLKEFLDKETPAKYEPTPVTKLPPKPQSYRDQVSSATAPSPAQKAATDSEKPVVPAASLFPDGRYAHIWKTYQPLEAVEGPSESPTEKVLAQFKRRKEALNKAALENCAEEHLTLANCFRNGDFSDRLRARMTMCRLQNSKFARCYTMQAKFLQALGYGASFEWDAEKEERIQMHADKLYHQMLDYEEKVAEAKAAGREPPPLKSLFNPNYTPKSPAEGTGELEIPGGEELPPGTRLEKQLKDLTPHERELEVRALKQQIEQRNLYLKEVLPVLEAEKEGKVKRREVLIKWFGPTIGKWLA
ncbi:hypothetical protein VTO42DRAFT_5734 [Malbranchea cinnamomea]